MTDIPFVAERYSAPLGGNFLGLTVSYLRGFFVAVSSRKLRTAAFLTFWLIGDFFFRSSVELVLSSESEDEDTLSPELLLERYLLLLVFERFDLLISVIAPDF